MKTSVKIHKVFEPENKIRAVASITLDDMFVVHGVRLVQSGNSKFITMPCDVWQNKQGETMRKDVFHPISTEARKQLEDAVFNEYDRLLSEKSTPQK